MTNEMDDMAVGIETAGAADEMPEANEMDVMGDGDAPASIESELMPGEEASVAAETEMAAAEDMDAAGDPMGARELSMSVAAARQPIELAGNWKLTLSINS